MNKYDFDGNSGAMFIYFYSSLDGAEFDEVVLSAAKDTLPKPLNKVSSIVADLRDITNADLTDTDGARVAIFQMKLQKILGVTDAKFRDIYLRVKVVSIVDPESAAGQIFTQRVARTSQGEMGDEQIVVTSVKEAANYAGLSVSFVEGKLSALAASS